LQTPLLTSHALFEPKRMQSSMLPKSIWQAGVQPKPPTTSGWQRKSGRAQVAPKPEQVSTQSVSSSNGEQTDPAGQLQLVPPQVWVQKPPVKELKSVSL
jgi:hypothetical protein